MNLCTAALVLLAGIVAAMPPGDLDATWQIRTGRLILAERRLQLTDQFSYTIAGQPLPDYEWLYEVGLASLYDTFGEPGLRFARVVVVGLPLALLVLGLTRSGIRWHGVALALGLAAVITLPNWNLRPMFLTSAGLLFVALRLRDHARGGRPLGPELPVIMLLWANLHPGVVTGQGLLTGAVVLELLNARWGCWPPLSRERLRGLAIWGLLGVAVTFVSPDPIGRLLYPFSSDVRHPIQREFVEMQPSWLFITRPPYTSGLAYGLFAGVMVLAVGRWREVRAWEWCLLGGTFGLAQIADRSKLDWVLTTLLIGMPLVPGALTAAARRDRRRLLTTLLLRLDRSARRTLSAPAFRPRPGWLLAALAVFAGLVATRSLDGVRWPSHPEAPEAALDWAVAHGLPGPTPWKVFGRPDDGTYVGWRLDGKARVWADTRGFYFPGQVQEDAIRLPQADATWPERLERVLASGTDYFLLNTTGPSGRLWLEVLEPIVGEPLYRDERAVWLTREQVARALNN